MVSSLITNILLFTLFCFLLAQSGSIIIKSILRLSRLLKLKTFLISFFLMAFFTSIPELFVGINAALRFNSELALGNVIGSNILNITLIIGIVLLLGRQIKIESPLIKRSNFYMIFILSLPLLMMLIGGSISRLDGLILILIAIGYGVWMYMKRDEFSKVMKVSKMNHLKKQISNKKVASTIKFTLLFIFGVALLLVSASFTVEFATRVLNQLAFSPLLIGLFLISLGTTLPELTFEIKSVMINHSEMVLGNLIGTIVINSTLVLGITALLYPIVPQSFLLFLISAVFMIVLGIIFFVFAQSENKLTWQEGMALILLYFLFVVVEFSVKALV